LQKSMIRLLSVADLISITNAIFGFLAILFLVSEIIEPGLRMRVSFTFILLALLADGLDGIVARKLGKSDIGEYLESMADMTSLGIAPAVFIYFIYSDLVASSIYNHIYLLFALILFLSFGIIRLASFHIMKKDRFFYGLPASASTLLLLIFAYFVVDFIFILPAVIVIGAFMASDIKFPKPGVRINGIAAVLILLTLVFDKSFYGFAPLLLFFSILFYSVAGPIFLSRKAVNIY